MFSLLLSFNIGFLTYLKNPFFQHMTYQIIFDQIIHLRWPSLIWHCMSYLKQQITHSWPVYCAYFHLLLILLI